MNKKLLSLIGLLTIPVALAVWIVSNDFDKTAFITLSNTEQIEVEYNDNSANESVSSSEEITRNYLVSARTTDGTHSVTWTPSLVVEDVLDECDNTNDCNFTGFSGTMTINNNYQGHEYVLSCQAHSCPQVARLRVNIVCNDC